MKMTNLTGLGIGLSLVFGCLFIGLVAELYYLLWWKNRVVNREIGEEDCRSQSKGFFSLLLRRKRPISAVHGGDTKDPDLNGPEEEEDPELGSGKNLIVKDFGEEGIESELKRLHNLAGPPRFLFTITEETREDLETESVKSRTRSLSDIVIASPNMNSSPSLLGSFNPLFETELAGVKSSPEPTFKFLRDAEEKLRLKDEKRVSENGGLVASREDFEAKDESFVAIIISKTNNREP